jgi:aspartate 1-decarboxylase
LELQKFEPELVYVDNRNRIVNRRHQIPVQAA